MRISNTKRPQWVDYYASVEIVSASSDGFPNDSLATIVIDAIPKMVVKAIKGLESTEVINDLENNFPIFMLTAEIDSVLAKVMENNDTWLELSIGRDRSGDETAFEAKAIAFSSEDGAQELFWVKVIKSSVAKQNLSHLAKLAEVRAVADSDKNDLDEFDCAFSTAGVAVYDVGQANFCALVDGNEHPVVFFDLGWPLNFNKKSLRLPGPFDPFALERINGDETPVILSHLDWDHWGFAHESGMARYDEEKGYWRSEVFYKNEALNRRWLMRRPRFHRHKLGPSHIHFVLTLSSTILRDGKPALTFWPARQAKLSFESYTVIRCSPTIRIGTNAAYLRNNESLAVIVQLRNESGKVLLSGDADYPSIPAGHLRGLTGIVAPHHGGAVTDWSIPVPSRENSMIMSTYSGCYSNVPSRDTEYEACLKGWAIQSTDSRITCPNGCCISGNKLIPLSSVRPRCSCGIVPESGLCLG